MELRLIESSINFATSILLLIESKNVKSNFSKVVFSSKLTQNLSSRGWQHEFLIVMLSPSYSVQSDKGGHAVDSVRSVSTSENLSPGHLSTGRQPPGGDTHGQSHIGGGH